MTIKDAAAQSHRADKGKPANIHSHTWVVGVLGLFLGLALMIYVPSLKAISGSILLFAGFHILGGLIVLFSAYSLGMRRILRRMLGRTGSQAAENSYDFGWGPEWMNGLAVFGAAAFAGAITIMLSAPAFWPVAFVLLALSIAFFIGNGVMRSFRSSDHMVLPAVSLLRGEGDLVLDAGCGAGRTTIALARVLPSDARVIAFDRFDAEYIDEGGLTHIRRNLQIAGIADRVTILQGDLKALPLPDNHVTAAISTNAFDHLGKAKAPALAEIHRVLQPGGRFLMSVWVPGWTMFTIGNVLSFFLTSRHQWRTLAASVGLRVVDEGIFNFAWFVVLEKPLSPELTS